MERYNDFEKFLIGKEDFSVVVIGYVIVNIWIRVMFLWLNFLFREGVSWRLEIDDVFIFVE